MKSIPWWVWLGAFIAVAWHLKGKQPLDAPLFGDPDYAGHPRNAGASGSW